jgi:hypothetical protein
VLDRTPIRVVERQRGEPSQRASLSNALQDLAERDHVVRGADPTYELLEATHVEVERGVPQSAVP